MTVADPVPDFLEDGPAEAPLTVALAHGAGAPMDSPFMAAFAQGIATRGFRVVRFEFPYMAARRQGGAKRPPDPAPRLMACWHTVINHLGPHHLVIGGKSLGGRMASMVTDEAGVRGLVCLGYPFHPPGRPDRLRVDHLRNLRTPSLIVQGARDTLGSEDEVRGYPLSAAIGIRWLGDGDHGFRPRRASGRTEADNWAEGIDAIARFLAEL
jgi:predicted alpha/beta-hydrolase family hydrolase